jgi:uncharacterized protein
MISRLSRSLSVFICAHPWLVVAVTLAFSAAGAFLTKNIKIHSSFSDLLPDQSQAVQDLESISKRIGGRGTLMVQVEGGDLKAMERFTDALVARLKAYPKSEILYVDYKVDEQKAFFDRNKYLYMSARELTKLRDDIQTRVDEETAKANPFFVDLSDDDGAKEKKPKLDLKAERAKYEEKLRKFDKYIDGYLTNEAGTMLLIVIKTPGSNTGVAFAERFTKKVEAEIASLAPASFHPGLRANLTGELKDIPAEYEALRSDIVIVSNLCTVAILLAVFLYFRSIKMLLILTVGLGGGLLTTFGIVYLRIGYLTSATAFLAAIVAGNGINFGIYFLARFMEERTNGGEIVDILSRSLSGTFLSVATAALAAGTAYASLMVTQFKGFNQFGFIGGVGMVICLLYALTLVPALTVIVERRFSFRNVSKTDHERGRIFSAASALLVTRFPKIVLGAGVVALVASGVSLAFFLRDPFEYDFRKLRNQYAKDEDLAQRSSDADAILGERSSPHIFLADSVEQVPKIKAALEPYADPKAPEEDRAIKWIRTVNDFIPGSVAEQEKKIAVLGEIRELIQGRVFKTLKPADQKEIERLTPPADLRPVTLGNLPEEIVRPYVELDGTRGTLMYVNMRGSVWNGPSIFRFARIIREVKLNDGKVVHSSGKVVIFNDMIQHVRDEGPWATLVAFCAVMVLIAAVYRDRRDVLVLSAAMISGVILMLGAAVALGQKINFLNYIAIPIQFGIGVDYTVNVYSRFKQEGPGSIGRVLRSTGGAVMITSATTIIGYGAMWFSINGAINSFATLANIGETTCLLTATLFAPAAMALFLKGLPQREAA